MYLKCSARGGTLELACTKDQPSGGGSTVSSVHRRATRSTEGPGALIVCGRFEGVDERVIEGRALEEISIGDYVLSGGEIAALALLDACVRLLPGVMGGADSGSEESFENGLLVVEQFDQLP